MTVARDQQVSIGDIIMSRSNDATITVHPGPDQQHSDRVDQVRNGNRWRVAAIDPNTNRIAAQRLSDGARVVFGSDYLQGHVTLGYAATVHSAQGVTADSSYAILGEGASRAMLYVVMTRGRSNNEAFLYQSFTKEADHDHTASAATNELHFSHRCNKYSAAQHFRTILAKDDRPRTVHTVAERTESYMLPGTVADLLQRSQFRWRARIAAWRNHIRTAEAWHAGQDRMAATAASRSAGRYEAAEGLEL